MAEYYTKEYVGLLLLRIHSLITPGVYDKEYAYQMSKIQESKNSNIVCYSGENYICRMDLSSQCMITQQNGRFYESNDRTITPFRLIVMFESNLDEIIEWMIEEGFDPITIVKNQYKMCKN